MTCLSSPAKSKNVANVCFLQWHYSTSSYSIVDFEILQQAGAAMTDIFGTPFHSIYVLAQIFYPRVAWLMISRVDLSAYVG